MPEPQGKKRSCKLGPHPEAVRPGPFRQLAGHRSQKGSRKKHKTRGLSHSVLLLSSSETGQKKPLPGPLSRGKAGLDLAPTWSWETAFSSHSGRHRKKLHSRTSVCACKTDKMGTQWVTGLCCSVAKSCPILCNHGLHMPGSSVLHYPLEFAHIHVR